MHIEFHDEVVWVAKTTSVFFRAKADGKTVRCFVSREALDDHFGGDNADDYVPIFLKHRNEILAVTEKMIREGCVSNPRDLAFQHILGLNPCLAVGVLKCAL